jgi:hypothetical protein
MRANGDDPLAVLDAKKDARRVERAAAEATKAADANRPLSAGSSRASSGPQLQCSK